MKNKLPSSGEEIAEVAIKGAISMIPVVGGLIAELGSCLISPLDKRKRAWSEEVEKALKELSTNYERLPDSLAEDPAFVTALLKATTVALATHQEAKIRALRNFVVAVGAKTLPEDELQQALLRLLEDFSVGHLEVISFLDASQREIETEKNLEAIYDLYQRKNEGQLDRMAFRWILADLASRMVVHLGDIEDMNEFASGLGRVLSVGSTVKPLQVTELGLHFLKLLRNT
jgi:hypothetical protein